MEPLEYSKLLENYFEGISSLEEENQLRRYLKQYAGNNPDLLEAKILFSFMNAERTETSSLDFDALVKTRKPSKIIKMLIYAGSIAAAAVIILSINYMIKVTESPVVYAYINGEPITNKEAALEYSKQAIMDLSVQFNKGTESLSCMIKLNKPAALLTTQKQ